jgi:hypothetical protein
MAIIRITTLENSLPQARSRIADVVTVRRRPGSEEARAYTEILRVIRVVQTGEEPKGRKI